jgi:siderophore synthetase component
MTVLIQETAQETAQERAERTSEDYLVRRVLDALLREDYRGLRSGAVLTTLPGVEDGSWLVQGGLALPVEPDGFLCDYRLRLGQVLRAGKSLTGLDEILSALRPAEDAEEQAGFDVFADECRQALAAVELRYPGDDRSGEPPTGMRSSLHAEVLAARTAHHPAYPTPQARLGLTAADLRSYAPEFGPAFDLRWVVVPRDTLALHGPLPSGWPSCRLLGLPERLDASHLPVPVHPLTWDGPLDEALAAAGLAGRAVRAPRAHLTVTPTLSMRTVALVDDPGLHLKLPLPMATLGSRNRRSIVPGTLPDGDLTNGILQEILRREPALADRVLLPDEGTYGHAGQEYLGFLARRYPRHLDRSRVVPVAALLADTGMGRLVVEELAEQFFADDVTRLLDAYLTLLFRWHTTLWLRYGVALESHQQNVSLVLDQPRRVRLLYKDNDGPRIDLGRLARALGAAAPAADRFADTRILAESPDELADVYTTITVHLCAAALAFGLAERGLADRDQLLRLVRTRIEDSLSGLFGERDAGLFRAAVLEAARLPVKSMVTAGTLRSKERTGARDINKYYGSTTANYLRAAT